ncbi:protein L27 [Seminavis robusta]|uniref:Protein L27 n=1 Tax=Seminavis robusta TaxID=568900 RepID=A0A9N8HTY2_9STRA|nr:protein L27 [Seminavis robusta]|eukprot:Sro1328_g263130.1 protein L27 (126) ;mRNA; f:1328-1705
MSTSISLLWRTSQQVALRRPVPSFPSTATVRGMATKKQGGSSGNGRDSAGRRLGIKLYPGMKAKAGSIVIRQRGAKFRPGDNVGMGKDHTIFATQPGVVQFSRHPYHKKKRHIVSILQQEEQAMA